MYTPARIAICLSISAVMLTPVAGLAASASGYLNWSNKAAAAGPTVQDQATQDQAPVEEIHTASGSYPVPPSAYGQVGDPYARSLRWPTKQAPAQVAAPPVQVAAQMPPPHAPHAVYQPMPQAPVRAEPMTANAAPVEMRQPQPPRVVAVPQTQPVPQPEDPGLADDPDLTPEAPVAERQPTAHADQMAVSRPLPAPQTAPVPRPVVAPPAAPAVASVAPVRPDKKPETKPETKPAPVVATAPEPVSAPAAAYHDGGYQIPATSKYAARIQSARDAQADAEKADQVAAVTKPSRGKKAEKPADQPTVPVATPSLASEETDHVFIPGERATDASDEPRFYSLHRQYGMKPDPITVDHNATGALLGLNGLDAVEGGDPNNDNDSTDTHSIDSGAQKPDTTQPDSASR